MVQACDGMSVLCSDGMNIFGTPDFLGPRYFVGT